jgi:hypothetical protein
VQGRNPICTFCNTADRFDPGDETIFQIHKKINPVFEEAGQDPDNGDGDNKVKIIEKNIGENFCACKK